jgi:4-amino-4-deoxy-L-arabinose transferase-like glycosyltransferase
MENFCKRYSVFFIFIILVLAVFFRLYQLTTIPPGLYPDEAMNGNNALEAISAQGGPSSGWKIFYPENYGREGLFINLQAQSIKIFGNEPWALRIVSVLFGVLTVLGLYLLTKELFKKESVALFASFFLAVSFWHINFSRIGFRAIMAPFFLVWSLYFLWKALGSRTSTWKSCFQVVLAGLIFGLGFYSYIAFRIAPILLVPPFLLLLKNKKILIILFFVIGALITVYPLTNYFYHNPQDFFGRTTQISIFSSESPLLDLGKNIVKTAGMFFWAGDYNWRHNIAGAPQLWWPISILFLIGIISQISKIKSQNYILNLKSIFLILWLTIMLAPVVISSEGIPHALRAIIVVPAAMIFAGLGLDWLNGRLKKELMILFFVFLIVVAINSYKQYFLDWAGNPNVQGAFAKNYAELGNYLRYSPQDIKKYVIINAEGVDVRGIPMPSQTVMFLTDTFRPEQQKEKNIFYILPQNLDDFIKTAKNEEKLQIFMLEIDPLLRQKISAHIPGIFTYENAGILIQEK